MVLKDLNMLENTSVILLSYSDNFRGSQCLPEAQSLLLTRYHDTLKCARAYLVMNLIHIEIH